MAYTQMFSITQNLRSFPCQKLWNPFKKELVEQQAAFLCSEKKSAEHLRFYSSHLDSSVFIRACPFGDSKKVEYTSNYSTAVGDFSCCSDGHVTIRIVPEIGACGSKSFLSPSTFLIPVMWAYPPYLLSKMKK